jgi:hypothetical protein
MTELLPRIAPVEALVISPTTWVVYWGGVILIGAIVMVVTYRHQQSTPVG